MLRALRLDLHCTNVGYVERQQSQKAVACRASRLVHAPNVSALHVGRHGSRNGKHVVDGHALPVDPQQHVASPLADDALALDLPPIEPAAIEGALSPAWATAAPCPLSVWVLRLHEPYPAAVREFGVRDPVSGVHFVCLLVDDVR